MNNLTTFALNNIHFKTQLDMAMRQDETIMSLREKALSLVERAESEELLAEVIGLLSGSSLPCAYSHEQMEASLQEAETDFQNGSFVSHSSICDRYDIYFIERIVYILLQYGIVGRAVEFSFKLYFSNRKKIDYYGKAHHLMDSETGTFGGGKRNGKGGHQARTGKLGGQSAGID